MDFTQITRYHTYLIIISHEDFVLKQCGAGALAEEKMNIHRHIFIYIVLVTQNFAKVVEIKCPDHCKCDFVNQLKRATCTNKKLAVIEANLPNQTQVLDMSDNQISHLEEKTFIKQNLLSLKLLNISHNKVSQIHMNAFEGLNHLKTLDLSYNALHYVTLNWFQSLKSLEELYLRGNSFSKIDAEPFFVSPTLKVLDLSKCNIAHVANDALAQIPNLQRLDLSENFLIHLSVEVIKPLKGLEVLKVNNNTLSCDGDLEKLRNFCVQKGIRFKDPCQQKFSTSNKFERIINMAEPENEKNSWLYDDEEEIRQNVTIIQKCNETRSEDKGLLQEIVELSPLLSILIPFIYGVAVGLLIGCTVQIKPKKRVVKDDFTYLSFTEEEPLPRRRSRYSRAVSKEERVSLPLQEWKLSESTPVLFRKNQAC